VTMTRVTTLIIATFALLGGLAFLTAGPCSAMTNGPCDRFVFGPPPPVIFDVDVTEAVDPATLDASNFTVNGIPADTVALTNGDMTISFHFNTSPARQGANITHIPSGAFNCLSGPVLEFTCGFRYIVERPRPTPHPRPIPPQ
jgi:hypothetical protein